jgi:hypothetical protein
LRFPLAFAGKRPGQALRFLKDPVAERCRKRHLVRPPPGGEGQGCDAEDGLD